MKVYFPRAVDNPRAMPELRAALIDMAKPDSIWVQAEIEKLTTSIAGPGAVEHQGNAVRVQSPPDLGPIETMRRIDMAIQQANNTVRWYHERLPDAQLIHVTPEMTDFICAAAEHVPHNMALTLADAPAPAGLVVFARPVLGTDAGPERTGEQVRVDGVFWASVTLPARDIPWYDEQSTNLLIHGVSIASFRMIAPEHEDVIAQAFHIAEPMWVPLGRSDWPWGDEMGDKPSLHLPHESDLQWESMQEDRRLLAALWATLNQKRLISTEEVRPGPNTRKRLERRGHGNRDETVQIVHLRRTEYQTVERTDHGRHVGVRFVVRPHYRRQPYGPGRSLRRIVLVPAHWRGPDDAPVSHAERVWEVDR